MLSLIELPYLRLPLFVIGLCGSNCCGMRIDPLAAMRRRLLVSRFGVARGQGTCRLDALLTFHNAEHLLVNLSLSAPPLTPR